MQLNFWERQFVNSPLRWALQRLVVQWFKGPIHLEPGSGVLEIGCGRGAGAKMILRQFDPALLFLLEVDWRMIDAALRHLADDNGRVSFACGDASALPFKDERIEFHHEVNPGKVKQRPEKNLIK
jgi:ubiquinone/menaquinone biosynthesis C-methylase UbiE